MKIAHFTDLHINSNAFESNINETIALFNAAIKMGADHYCLTGDISHNAEPIDFETLRYILESFNLLDGEKASIVIGNHDIYGGPQKAEDIFSFPQKCRDINYNGRVELFTSYFKELYDSCFYRPVDKLYPNAKIINNILLIGLNSVERYSLKNPFASNGFIDEEQLSEIEKILKEYGSYVKHRLVLIHHHFNKIKTPTSNMMHYFRQVVEKQTMKLKKKKELMQLFKEQKVELVMHGHIHENINYQGKGIQFLNSGGCFNNIKKGELSFRVIEINKKGISTKIISLPAPKREKKYVQQSTTDLGSGLRLEATKTNYSFLN
jgi:3',5'-cyclic AMP phosphodiesterase CpdA